MSTSILSTLPPTTPKADGSTAHQIRTVITSLLPQPPYTPTNPPPAPNPVNNPVLIHFTHVPLNLVEYSNDHPAEIFIYKRSRILYLAEAQDLLVKLTSAPLEIAQGEFSKYISVMSSRMGDTEGERNRGLGGIILNGSARCCSSEGGIAMEPDASFEPFQCQSHQRPPTWEVEGGPRVRSSVVVECGYEEHMAYLRERARLWVRISEGGVRAVVLIFLGKDRKKIVFEKWVPDWCRCFEGGAVCGASVEITRDEDGDGQVVVAGAPLMVRFREMFRRDPTEDGERDYVFAEDELGDMAEVVWMRMEDFAEGG